MVALKSSQSSFFVVVYLMKNKGFTLIETVVAVAVAGAIVTMAVPLYNLAVAKTQASEAEKLIQAERLLVVSNLSKGYCSAPGLSNLKAGRYGSLRTNGTPSGKLKDSCDSGCSLEYVFSSDVNKEIANKKLIVNIKQDGGVYVDDSTTLAKKFISSGLKLGVKNTADNCASIAETNPTITSETGGGGVEVGEVDPSLPPQTGGESGGVTGGGGSGSGGTTPLPVDPPSPPVDAGDVEVPPDTPMYKGWNDTLPANKYSFIYRNHSTNRVTLPNGTILKDFTFRHVFITWITFNVVSGPAPKTLKVRIVNTAGHEKIAEFKYLPCSGDCVSYNVDTYDGLGVRRTQAMQMNEPIRADTYYDSLWGNGVTLYYLDATF